MAVPVLIGRAATSQPMSDFRMPLATSDFPGVMPAAGDLYVVLVSLSGGNHITAPPGWTWATGGRGPGYVSAVFHKILDGHDMDVCFTGDSAGQWRGEGYIAFPA